MRHGSLCSGYGGLDLAVESIFDTSCAWFSEFDAAPAQVFSHHWPDVENIGDLTTVDWGSLEPIDLLTAGYPCQPFSHAGKRQGADDDRHLWPYIADAIGVLRPRYVVLENVAGHVSLGFDRVLADLAALGFDAEWCVVRASDIGACHGRARLFIVAFYTDGPRLQGATGGRVQQREPLPRRGAVADAEGHEQREPSEPRPLRPEPRDGAAGVAWGAYEHAIRRHARLVGRPAPRPTDDRGRLAPEFVEWMMCLPAGWVTDMLTSRTKALKCLGNGVVPPQAAYALRLLLDRVQERAAA